MKKAIYYRLIILTCVAILVCSLISTMVYAVYSQNQTKEWLRKLTLSTAENYKYNTDVRSLSESAGNNRVTTIAADGKVLADSEANAADMENHANREEVKHAKPHKVYITIRTSHTLGKKYMYGAVKTDDGTIIRLAHSYSGILHNMTVQLPAILTAILVAFILSLFLAGRFSKAVTNPLEKVVDALSAQEYTNLRNYSSPYYEINKMMISIQALLQKTADSKEELLDEREKLNYTLSNQKQLEQQKRDFFSNASHELKTPVTSILGFSEMLNQGIVNSDAEKEDVMKRIETEAKRLSELINDILTISQLESNNTEEEHMDFYFDDAVREAVNSISPIKDNASVKIHMDLDQVSFCANKRQIRELCVNLIENAVKYNKPNGSVSISLKTTDQNAVLTIKDTGIGIPAESQTRVFERFFRVDHGRDKKVGGTGLGLSIVKHIVNIYGGDLSLHSKLEEGTTIVVSLPR